MIFKYLIFSLFHILYISKNIINASKYNLINSNLNSNDCYLDEGRVCVNATSVILNRGMNPGGFLIMRCIITEIGEGENFNPLVQIQAATPSNYTTLLYNINHDSVEIFDLSWSFTNSKANLPDNTTFSKNDTIHFAIGIDTNSMSTIVVNSKNILRLQFKGSEHLTKFKSQKAGPCSWKYEMSLTFPETKLNVKYAPEINNSTQALDPDIVGNNTESKNVNYTGEITKK